MNIKLKKISERGGLYEDKDMLILNFLLEAKHFIGGILK